MIKRLNTRITRWRFKKKMDRTLYKSDDVIFEVVTISVDTPEE